MPPPRSVIKYVLAYALTCAAVIAPVALNHDLRVLAGHDRVSGDPPRPVLDLGPVGRFEYRATPASAACARGALAFAVAFVPARRGIVEVAALGSGRDHLATAVLTYWFYLYIVWFFPLVIVALLAAEPKAADEEVSVPPSGIARPQPV